MLLNGLWKTSGERMYVLAVGGQLLWRVCWGDEGDRFLQAWGQTLPGKPETCSDRNRNGHNVTQPNLWSPTTCPLLNPVLLPLPSRAGRLVSIWGWRKRETISPFHQLQPRVGDLPVSTCMLSSQPPARRFCCTSLAGLKEHCSSEYFFLDEVLRCHSQLAVCPSFSFCALQISHWRVVQPSTPCWV